MATWKTIVTAGLKWAPKTCHTAYAIVTTVRRSQRDPGEGGTQVHGAPEPKVGVDRKPAAMTGDPRALRTSQNVSTNSASRRLDISAATTAINVAHPGRTVRGATWPTGSVTPVKIYAVGLGYVGLSNAIVLAYNHEVVAVDLSAERVAQVNGGRSPLDDPELEMYVALDGLSLTATTTSADALRGPDSVIVATRTNCRSPTSSMPARLSQSSRRWRSSRQRRRSS